MQFCQGLADKETAYQVSLKEPKNIDDAIHGVRWCQHVRKVIFGTKRSEDRFIEKQMGKVAKTQFPPALQCPNSLWHFRLVIDL